MWLYKPGADDIYFSTCGRVNLCSVVCGLIPLKSPTGHGLHAVLNPRLLRDEPEEEKAKRTEEEV